MYLAKSSECSEFSFPIATLNSFARKYLCPLVMAANKALSGASNDVPHPVQGTVMDSTESVTVISMSSVVAKNGFSFVFPLLITSSEWITSRTPGTTATP